MRDVALAALIRLSGQDVNTYNFPALQTFRGNVNLPPNYYGFSDDKGRAEAMKKWKATQAAPAKNK